MRMPARALCVLTACSAIVGVAAAPAEARKPFDVHVVRVDSPFFQSSQTYVRTRPRGGIKIDRVHVQNSGPARAPATKVAFRWTKGGPIVETVSVRPMAAAFDVARTSSVRVPFPNRNGRYHLWICADTPRAGPPERRANNCFPVRKLVIVDRQGPVRLDVAPTSWDFGSVPVGTSAETQNFTVRNLGPGDTGPGGASIAGPGAGAFDIPTNGCIEGLSGTSACRIRVTFTPFAAGSYAEDLVISFFEGYELHVPLTGTGI